MSTLSVLIAGATAQMTYHLMCLLDGGEMFGKNQKLVLHLLDDEDMITVNVKEDVVDGAFSLLTAIDVTDKPEKAFKEVDVAILIEKMPHPGGSRMHMLSTNVMIFKSHSRYLDKYAKKDIKGLVVGNTSNATAFVCAHYASTIPQQNFTSMTRLD